MNHISALVFLTLLQENRSVTYPAEPIIVESDDAVPGDGIRGSFRAVSKINAVHANRPRLVGTLTTLSSREIDSNFAVPSRTCRAEHLLQQPRFNVYFWAAKLHQSAGGSYRAEDAEANCAG